MNVYKAFIFQNGLNLKLFFLKPKAQSSHEINLLCDRKYKHEFKENRKVLALIIDKIIGLEDLVYLSVVIGMTQSII